MFRWISVYCLKLISHYPHSTGWKTSTVPWIFMTYLLSSYCSDALFARVCWTWSWGDVSWCIMMYPFGGYTRWCVWICIDPSCGSLYFQLLYCDDLRSFQPVEQGTRPLRIVFSVLVGLMFLFSAPEIPFLGGTLRNVAYLGMNYKGEHSVSIHGLTMA